MGKVRELDFLSLIRHAYKQNDMSVPEKFTGFAAKSKGKKYFCDSPSDQIGAELEQIEFTPAPLGTNDVTVRVLYCGLCYSDVHMIDSDVKFNALYFI